MARTKLVDGVRVPLTAEEEALRDAEDAAFAAKLTVEAAVAYRRARKEAYIAQLGPDPQFDNTVGDVLDVLIAQIRVLAAGNETAEFAAMVAAVDAIKAAHPKPE